MLRLKTEIGENSEKVEEQMNNPDKYSQRNNSKETREMVIDQINTKIPWPKFTTKDIYTAHRLTQYNKTRNAVIVNWNRGWRKQHTVRKNRFMNNFFINKDMMKTNMEVLQSVVLQQTDFVKSAGLRETIIFYRDVNEMVHSWVYKTLNFY